MALLHLTFTLAQKVPLPLSLPQEAKEGEGAGGAGLPLGTAVAQSISPKPRNFLLPKRKKKKKKNPSGHFSSLPHWDRWDWICGVSREGGSGLEHSQARVVEFPGRPSARPTLGFSPLLPFFPSKQTTRGGLPLPPRPWAAGLGARGQAGVLRSPGEGGAAVGALASLTLYPLPFLPQSWAFPSTSCCGDIYSPPQKSVPSSPVPPARRADPGLRGGGDCRADGLLRPGPLGLLLFSEQDAGLLHSGRAFV